VGCVLFGGSIAIFGMQHLLYRGFLATLIPSWIPWPLFLGRVRRRGVHRGCRRHRNEQGRHAPLRSRWERCSA